MTVAVFPATNPNAVVLDVLPHLLLQAAHDLNNNLASILGKSEIALLHDDPHRWRRGLEETLDAGNQARVLVADLQRVVTWQQADAGPVPLTDVLAMVARLASRSLRRFGKEVVVTSSAGVHRVEQPAVVALALWLLLREALERAGRTDGSAWQLGAHRSVGGWSIELASPGFEWPVDIAVALADAQCGGVPPEGPLGMVLRSVQALGGELHVAREVAEIRFES